MLQNIQKFADPIRIATVGQDKRVVVIRSSGRNR